MADLASLTTLAFAPVDQQYLLEARQMQALSFAAHTPLVCFGVAFPGGALGTRARRIRGNGSSGVTRR
jgi:cytochrome d ubiquinol oxidase subunit I